MSKPSLALTSNISLDILSGVEDVARIEWQIIHGNAKKILNALREADVDPEASWSEIREGLCLVAWALGLETARWLANCPDHRRRWPQSVAIAKAAWIDAQRIAATIED